MAFDRAGCRRRRIHVCRRHTARFASRHGNHCRRLASSRFPEQTEKLVLSVAANETAIGLQEAQLLSEQRRLADELDKRVQQRTHELADTNEMLRREIAERRRAEEALRARELSLRSIIDGIPGLVGILAPDGGV